MSRCPQFCTYEGAAHRCVRCGNLPRIPPALSYYGVPLPPTRKRSETEMPLNHPVRMTDANADWLAEDMAGAALVPTPTKEEDAALALELARENALAAAEEEGFESDDPVCEWCGEVVPDGASIHAPYCSSECERDATRETHHSIHPRPEEVGQADEAHTVR